MVQDRKTSEALMVRGQVFNNEPGNCRLLSAGTISAYKLEGLPAGEPVHRAGDLFLCELDLERRRVRWALSGHWSGYHPLLHKTGAYSFGVALYYPGAGSSPRIRAASHCPAVNG